MLLINYKVVDTRPAADNMNVCLYFSFKPLRVLRRINLMFITMLIYISKLV